MLIVENLTKSYGHAIVLNDISFSLERGSPVGLVGINGAGKSTLLKILAGQEQADAGKIVISTGETVGYLPQAIPYYTDTTIRSLIDASSETIHRIRQRITELEQRMSLGRDADNGAVLEEYGELAQRFEDSGGYEFEWKQAGILEGLGLGDIEKTRPVESLSGGEKTRLGLAVLLIKNPDILLLDEPTNNLDITCLGWLESYLSRYRGYVIAASHDRAFLNHTAKWIYEIDEHTHIMAKYPGNYDDFKNSRDTARLTWENEYKEQQAEIKELQNTIKSTSAGANRRMKKRDNDKYIINFKGERSQHLAKRTIRSAEERLSRILDDPIPRPPKPLVFTAGKIASGIRSQEVVRIERLSKTYDGKTILNGIDLLLKHDSRIVITGPNGSGKSTLLRLLSGAEQPDEGNIVFTPQAQPGFLFQEPEIPDTDLSVLEYYRRGMTGFEDDIVFDLVTTGLFAYDDIRKPVRQLSLGQVRKLEIARLIAGKPNVLFLDEPTNHVSLDVIESFESAIADFHGPVLAVSHDRRFMQRFGGQVLEIIDGKLNVQINQ